MLNNIIYSLNATLPIFLIIALGYLLKRIGWINKNFVKAINKINFTITLPALLIRDLMQTDFVKDFSLEFVLFCAISTSLCFFGTWFVSKKVMKDKTLVGELTQSAYRSSAAVLGAAFVLNMYGSTGMVPLMILGAVPLYNIYAVLVLSVECPEKDVDVKRTIGNTLKGIVTNPIIIAIVVGVVLSLIKVDFPKIVDNTIDLLATVSTPMALLAIGGAFEIGKALKMKKYTLIASFLKLVGWGLLFIPIAIAMGFRENKLIAIVIMLCLPATPSCFIMAKEMKAEGTLTSSVIVVTTLLSSVTLTGIIFILKTLGYL